MFIQGTCNGPANNTIQMKVYLTHGLTSVGSLGITADGATKLASKPWLETAEDKEAATAFMDRLLKMTTAPNSTLSFLSAGSVTGTNVTGADLIKEHVTGSHWVGTAKMGTKGDAGVVVDANALVYGTDNLFVVDASIHADLPTGNTQATVMVVAEHAVAKILALGGSAPGNGTAPPSSAPATPVSSAASAPVVSAPVGSYAASVPVSAVPSSTGAVSAPAAQPTSASASGSPPAPTATAVPLYGWCGGGTYNGPTQCAEGTCVEMNPWYSQCVRA